MSQGCWGYNEAPQFCIIPPIWSVWGMSQDWGYNQDPQLCTDPQFGPVGVHIHDIVSLVITLNMLWSSLAEGASISVESYPLYIAPRVVPYSWPTHTAQCAQRMVCDSCVIYAGAAIGCPIHPSIQRGTISSGVPSILFIRVHSIWVPLLLDSISIVLLFSSSCLFKCYHLVVTCCCGAL